MYRRAHKPAIQGRGRPSDPADKRTETERGGTKKWCGWGDSNSHTLRRQNLNLVCLPISPHPLNRSCMKNARLSLASSEYGVDDGFRTHDTRSHNPVLYQLSYAHHIPLLLRFTPSTSDSFATGAPGRIRTCGHPLRRRMLYPTELRAPGSHHRHPPRVSENARCTSRSR